MKKNFCLVNIWRLAVAMIILSFFLINWKPLSVKADNKVYLSTDIVHIYMKYGVKISLINAKKQPKWISENPDIATVSNRGYIRGVSPGRVKIVALLDGKKYTAITEVIFFVGINKLKQLEPFVEPKLIRAFRKLRFRYYPNLGLKDPYLNEVQGVGLFDIENRWIRSIDNDIYTTLHEFGHFLDHLKGYISSSNKFRTIFRLERRKMDDPHGRSATNEYFAESYMEYCLFPKELKKKRPKTYRFIKKAVSNISSKDIKMLRNKYKEVWERK